MKKILIVISDMHIGGIQKSLLELLKALSASQQYEVTLFCCQTAGAYMAQIPSDVKICGQNEYALISELSASGCRTYGWRAYGMRLCFSLWSRLFTKSLPAAVLCRRIGKIEGTYDIAISYAQPIHDRAFCKLTNEIVLSCVQAHRKISFVHCDFASYGGNTAHNRSLYRKFDCIAAVSDSVGKRFAEMVPEAAEKVCTVYNFCDWEEIRALADADPPVYDKPCIVTTARLSEEKGLLRCVPLFARLKKEGIPFTWHIVGGGPLQDSLTDAVHRCGLAEQIILEGEQINPYRYMKNADYFFLPSYHEAAPMVFDEALALQIPILTTNTLSAMELVDARGIGMVCDHDEESIYAMLRYVLTERPVFAMEKMPDQTVCMTQFENLCR